MNFYDSTAFAFSADMTYNGALKWSFFAHIFLCLWFNPKKVLPISLGERNL